MSADALNITIEGMTFRGLERQMQKAFQLKDTPVFYSTTDKYSTLNAIRKQKNIKLEYPLIMLKVTGYELRMDAYNPKALAREGVKGKIEDSKNTWVKNIPVPMNFTLEVTFISDDHKALRKFINRWMYAGLFKWLNMDIEFDGQPYSIQTELETNLQVPEKEMNPDQVNVYELTTSMVVKGYLSPDIPIDDMPRLYAVESIKVTPFLIYASAEKVAEGNVENDLVNAGLSYSVLSPQMLVKLINEGKILPQPVYLSREVFDSDTDFEQLLITLKDLGD